MCMPPRPALTSQRPYTAACALAVVCVPQHSSADAYQPLPDSVMLALSPAGPEFDCMHRSQYDPAWRIPAAKRAPFGPPCAQCGIWLTGCRKQQLIRSATPPAAVQSCKERCQSSQFNRHGPVTSCVAAQPHIKMPAHPQTGIAAPSSCTTAAATTAAGTWQHYIPSSCCG
jgi:hypothetical protein